MDVVGYWVVLVMSIIFGIFRLDWNRNLVNYGWWIMDNGGYLNKIFG